LAAQHPKIRDVVAAVGDRDREIAHDDTGIVNRTALPTRRQRRRQRVGEPEPISQLDQQNAPA